MSKMSEIRKRFVYHGRVQGVGFRYTSMLAAQSLGLTGWVRNQHDGTVMMEVQGSEYLINKLQVRLNTDRFIRIEWIDSEEIPIVENETKFNLKC